MPFCSKPYRCPTCAGHNPNAFVTCNHPMCPDGRDQEPIVHHDVDPTNVYVNVANASMPSWRVVAFILVLIWLVSLTPKAHGAQDSDPYDKWTSLASKYNCAWVAEKRKIYSDEELIKKAKRWHIPERIIALGQSCPR